MGEKKRKKDKKFQLIFEKRNYIIMIIGLVIIALGFILMSGGGSDSPEIFNAEVFNFRRIRLAPTLILIGFGVQVYAILTTSKNK